jgi:hypothetical protein
MSTRERDEARRAPGTGWGPEDDLEGERRIAVRHIACFPAHIEGDETRLRTAVLRDLSVTGTLLLTRAVFKPGDRVKLNLYLTADLSAPCLRSGRVVRFERRADEVAQIWPHRVAIEFDEPLHGYEDTIARVAEQQARSGLRPED